MNALQYSAPPEAQMMPSPGNRTMPAPAPAAPRANALAATPMMKVQPKAPAPNALGQALQSFARGFAPEQVQAVDDRYKADAAEKAKRALVWMKQTAAQPAERRAQFTLASAQDIARDTGQPYEAVVASAQDPNAFSDEALSGAIAKFSAMAGVEPAAPDYQFLQGPDGAISLGNKGTGQVQQLQPGTPKPKNPIIIGNNAYDPETYEPIIQGEDKPPWVGAVKDANGQWVYDPNYIKGYRQMHPGESSGGGAQFVDVPPAEMEALGYPKGTLGQRNVKTNELSVKSRPSTQMTGQPTESERKYAFYAKNAKHGLDVVNNMETKQGFNRADGWTWATSWTNQDARSYDQGMSQFIDSWLRAMTGAAATPSEIEFYKQQWTPQLGDGPDVIKQKRDARNQAVIDMEAAAGRGFPNGAPGMPEEPPASEYSPQQVAQAKAALANWDRIPAAFKTPQMRAMAEKIAGVGNEPRQADTGEDAFINSLFPDDNGDGAPDVPPEAVADLMSDPSPEAQAQFDEVFGQGAAASILNGPR